MKEADMKYVLILLAGLAASGAAAATAQIDPDPDGIGIYFDTAAAVHCASVPLAEPFEMYLILTNASATAGVAGWECRIEHQGFPPLLVLSYIAHNYNGSVWDPPNFMLGLDPPLPWSEAINLMTITAMILSPECVWFHIVPHPNATVPGQIVYLDAADYHHLIPMHPSTGGFQIPVAGVNCECPPPISVQAGSWGGVKAMYRH
jgi:hypothetical protein